jgi:two-component sensor histidine kinase
VLTELKRAQTGSAVTYQFRIGGPSETEQRWIESTAFPLVDEAGAIQRVGGIAKDITEQKASAARMEVLVAELQHRTRNLLGVVRSIAQQTMARTGPTERFREQFNDRLGALSRVQGLLSRSEQEPITLRALIQAELDALGAAAMQERITLAGPRVAMRKTTVQTFALALHELATNARKYGALTTQQGQLKITWRTYKAEDEGQRLKLEWLEEGIQGQREQQDPASRSGYGRELIERALPYALDAETRYELGETQLRCSIDLPLTERTGQKGT